MASITTPMTTSKPNTMTVVLGGGRSCRPVGATSCTFSSSTNFVPSPGAHRLDQLAGVGLPRLCLLQLGASSNCGPASTLRPRGYWRGVDWEDPFNISTRHNYLVPAIPQHELQEAFNPHVAPLVSRETPTIVAKECWVSIYARGAHHDHSTCCCCGNQGGGTRHGSISKTSERFLSEIPTLTHDKRDASLWQERCA